MTYIDEPIEHKGAQSETACCLIPLPAGLVTRRHHGGMPVGGQAGMRSCSMTPTLPGYDAFAALNGPDLERELYPRCKVVGNR